jgi:collagenase-like PrtC family protease
MIKKIFCLPYNGDSNLIKSIVENYKYKKATYEFYGSTGLFKSSRNFLNTDKNFQKTIELLHSNHIKFNYVLNSICTSEYMKEKFEIIKYLKYLKEIKIDSVTIVSDYFAQAAHDIGLQVNTSILHFINSNSMIEFLPKYYSRILIDNNINRQITKLESIIKSTKLPVEILVNNPCIINCPFQIEHYELVGSQEKELIIPKCPEVNPYLYYFKSTFIRPKDVDYYNKDLKVDLFKLNGRDFSTKQILQQFDCYLNKQESFVQDYVNIFNTGINIKCQDLDGYFEFIKCKFCSGNCFSCGKCSDFAKRLKENYE